MEQRHGSRPYAVSAHCGKLIELYAESMSNHLNHCRYTLFSTVVFSGGFLDVATSDATRITSKQLNITAEGAIIQMYMHTDVLANHNNYQCCLFLANFALFVIRTGSIIQLIPLDQPKVFLLFVAEPSPLWGCHYPTLDRLSDGDCVEGGRSGFVTHPPPTERSP